MSIDKAAQRPTDPARTCVFTIVSRNYLHFALNLMASVAEHLPGTRRVVVLCDARAGVSEAELGVPVLGIEELGIEHVDRMICQYTILELNTAIKPFAFTTLFAREDCDQVIYFDPDIQLFSSGQPLLDRLAVNDIVLTPHLTAPLDDDRHPSDLAILQSGTYNLGFLALRRGADSTALLAWWRQKLLRDCVVDIPRGLFTDQKWMDLVPGFFGSAYVERDAGWNVAYWNLKHRHFHREGDRYLVNGRPLFFFHFSGFEPAARRISKHQDRFTLDQCSEPVQALFALYAARLEQHGRGRFASIPYAFAALADGTRLPDCARQAIRNELDWNQPMPDLRSEVGARFLIDFLLAPVDGQQPPLTRMAVQLHRSRPDLQAAFPDILGAHREAYLRWFSERAGPEAGVTGVLTGAAVVSAQAGAPAESPLRSAAAGQVATAAVPVATRAASSLPYRVVYRLAWNARHVLRPLSSLAFRNRVRSYLVSRAFPAHRSATSAPAASTPETLPFGVSVIGYVKAESGVGESARSTLRALAHTPIAHSLTDFRAGNVSRMGEQVDEALNTGQRFAVSLFHINADQLPLARTMLGEAPFSVPYRIGFWAWELERFPAEWHGAFDHVDEVWVPSTFCQRAIAEVSPLPVLCMPHAVDIPARLVPDRVRFGLRQDSVVFLAMADIMSSAERKNPFGAIEAFVMAFGAGDLRAEMVVKVSNGERDPAAMARLRALAERCAGIHLITDYLDRPTLNTLLDTVDCFVSLHRAEGFGLVIAEAMARGKVVIATGWSGNMDFMSSHNAMPVDYRLQPLVADVGPYKQGERWAEPSLGDAAAKMRQVLDDTALRERLGRRAREDCAQMLSPEVIGRRVHDRVEALRRRGGLG